MEHLYRHIYLPWLYYKVIPGIVINVQIPDKHLFHNDHCHVGNLWCYKMKFYFQHPHFPKVVSPSPFAGFVISVTCLSFVLYLTNHQVVDTVIYFFITFLTSVLSSFSTLSLGLGNVSFLDFWYPPNCLILSPLSLSPSISLFLTLSLPILEKHTI